MPETSAIRIQTRRVKQLALSKAELILADETHPLHNETYLTVLKNTVPRTQELTGEEGEAINVRLMKYGEIAPANPEA